MKKKIFAALFGTILVLSAVAAFAYIKNNPTEKEQEIAKPVVLDTSGLPSSYDTGVTYKQAMKQKIPMMVLFYVDWCGYCKRFAPMIPELVKVNKGKMNIVMVNCEDPKNRDILQNYYIKGYPTVFVVDPVYDFKFQVSRTYPFEALQGELQKYINLRKNG